MYKNIAARSGLLLVALGATLLWAGPQSPAPTSGSNDSPSAERAKLFADAKQRAEAGDAKAMVEHGLNHILGIGTPIDTSTGAEWIRRSAEKGNEDAYFMYGQICQRGEMRTKDMKEALRWFRLAAAKQNADAELSLANAYEKGDGVPADAKESRRWLELSATHGHPIAQENLGLELGETQDPVQAQLANEWLRKSALQGSPSASIRLGVHYILGKGTPKNIPLGFAWILVGEAGGDEETREVARNYKGEARKGDLAKATPLARDILSQMQLHPIYALGAQQLADNQAFRAQFELAQRGKAADQYQLACLYHQGKGTLADPAEAAKWCHKAANQGLLAAIKSLASAYRDGDGVPEDAAQMLVWLRKAAELGDPDAQFETSVYLQHRNGDKSDLAEADVWLEKAASQGHPIAQANLGSRLFQSNDPDQRKEAVRWFKLSAGQGHPPGMFKYGVMLYLGLGIAKDEVEGAAWLIACDPGDDDGLRTAIKDILEKVPADKLAKAKAAAIEIRKTL